MKKNKSYENKIIKQQYNKLIIFNMTAFILVFIILGIVVIEIVKKQFFSDVTKSLEETKVMFDKEIREDKNGYRIRNYSARILMILYDENKNEIASSDELVRYTVDISGYELNPDYENELRSRAKQSDIYRLNNNLNEKNAFEMTTLNDATYNFITTSFEVDSINAPNVRFCKLLVMVNGEMSSMAKITSTYLLASTILIILGMLSSLFLSSKAIKPVSESLNKQLAFVSDASHELRTPLSIVQSKLENILTKKDATVFEVSEDIAISLKEVSRLNKLTSDLLALAHSDNDTSVLDIQKENITEIVSSTAVIFKEMAEIQGKVFNLNLESVEGYIDKAKITQLIIILLDNAVKYTSPGDLIGLSLINSGTDFIIKVSDTGIGISEETKKKIFERFYREDKARSRATGGNGLGLAIAKTIVLEHKGKIFVDHNVPKGTEFKIIISTKEK